MSENLQNDVLQGISNDIDAQMAEVDGMLDTVTQLQNGGLEEIVGQEATTLIEGAALASTLANGGLLDNLRTMLEGVFNRLGK